MKIRGKIALAAVCVPMLFFAAGCGNGGNAANTAGNAANATGNAVGNTVNATGNAVGNTANAVGNTMNNMTGNDTTNNS